MNGEPSPVIELDSNDDEELLISNHPTESPSASHSCELSSSSGITNVAPISQTGVRITGAISLKSSAETVRGLQKNNSNIVSPEKLSSKKIVVRSFPAKILPKPTHVIIRNDIPGTSETNIPKMRSMQNCIVLSPISSDTNTNFALLKGELLTKFSKKPVERTKVTKLVSSKLSNQQLKQVLQKLPKEIKCEKILQGKSTRRKIIRESIYLKDKATTEFTERVNLNEDSPKISCVTEEQDPLYIPAIQENSSSSSNMKQRECLFTSKNATSLKSPNNTNVSQTLPTQIATQKKDINVFTLSVPSNSEHSVVRNYTLLNKVTKKKSKSPIRCKSVPPGELNIYSTRTRTVDSDLIYRKILFNKINHSDNCRNFFIKNSAWNFLEPVFKGFNEREENISKSCSDYFSRLTQCLHRYEGKPEEILTNDDLYYTRKIELLDRKGKSMTGSKKRKVTPQKQVPNKRKENPTYTLPETKKCRVVLERDEFVENLLKKYLLNEKLNLNLSHHLNIPKDKANLPLIILKRINFNLVKINDSLCKHANIIYVKEVGEEFPEKLYKNDFIISQIENKTIKLVTPEGLKCYFM